MRYGGLARAAAAAALSLLLAACVTPQIKPETANSEQAQRAWSARRATLERVQNFSLQGRLAETGLVSFGGDLSWIQTGASFQARFYGPLGVGAVAISGVPGDMQIRTKDGSYETQQPEDFMQQQFGWSVPVDGLRYWVLGLPAPGRLDALQLDESGRILSLQQNGWTLAYTEYQTVGALELPRKFAISDPQRGFRIFVDTWSSVE